MRLTIIPKQIVLTDEKFRELIAAAARESLIAYQPPAFDVVNVVRVGDDWHLVLREHVAQEDTP